ncbi:hypothetical protein H5410_055704 [Solanum commersonii]|uniref:HAT C-terminal dimerisation domain-containing protein n=1 Tax=Solanum commersonii TaxID=4109 RepID=A0A9J5WJ39_SOLCO|nr:hypothetical protein H5410_055704 [Solanum commersonii]
MTHYPILMIYMLVLGDHDVLQFGWTLGTFKKLIETKKHLNYSLVFLLVKFVLLLPIATITVERAFLIIRLSRITCKIEWTMNS